MSKEEQEARLELVLTLPERIEAIPESSRWPATEGMAFTSSSNKNIKFDFGDCLFLAAVSLCYVAL